jgi:hypothetical protein
MVGRDLKLNFILWFWDRLIEDYRWNRDPFISFLQYLISKSNNGSLKISCQHLLHCFVEE